MYLSQDYRLVRLQSMRKRDRVVGGEPRTPRNKPALPRCR